MKKLLTSFALLILFFSANAQAPQKMSFQAVVRNSNNQIVSNAAVGMRISILQGSANGTSVFSETHNPTTNANGLATLEIGNGSVVSGTFAGINWANGPYFLKTESDPNGGTNYSITTTTQLLSVPYALYAETSGTPGTPGPTGAQGPAGPTGAAGTNGTNGTTGAQGPTGPTGAAGTNGTNGTNGATGATGPTGAAGTNGTNGTNGATGAQGPTGPTGAAGTNGTNGTNGATGATGPTGLTGAAGTNGTNGATGAQGPTGPTGTAGTNGATGATGLLSSGTTAGNTPYWDGTAWVTNNSNVFNNGGNVGIGTATTTAKLTVNGAAVNTLAFNAGSATTIDFSQSNLAYSSAIGTAFTLSNLKDGGAYSLILTGATNTGSAVFTATGFTVKYMGTIGMTTGKTHIYSFIVAGTNVYVSMATEN